MGGLSKDLEIQERSYEQLKYDDSSQIFDQSNYMAPNAQE